MANSFVQVPPDSTGKAVDATSLDVGATTVYRQRIVIGSDTGTATFAEVLSASAVAASHGLVVRPCTATVVVASGTINVNGGVAISGTATVVGVMELTAGTANIGFLNSISRTVQVAVGTPFIIQGISTTVQVAIGTPFTINNISAVVAVTGGVAISGTATVVNATASPMMIAAIDVTDGSRVNVGDSANTAIRVNIVAGAAGGVSQVDGTTFSTQAANFVPMGGIFDDAASNTLSENDAGVVRLTTNRAMHINHRTDGGVAMEDSANSALRVNVVAGSSGGVSQVDGTTFSTQAANFVPVGGIFDDATSDALSENDAGVVRLTTARGFHVNLRDAAGAGLGTAGAALAVNVHAISGTASVVLAAGTANFGTLNDISRTVQVAIGTPFTLQGISTTVQVAIGTPFTVNNISAVVAVTGGVAISGTAAVTLATASFVTVRQIVGTLANNSAGTALTAKYAFAKVSTASSTLVAAVASRSISVLGYRIQAQGTVDVQFGAGSSGTTLSQRWSFQAREGIAINAPHGAYEFQTSAGEGLTVQVSAAVTADVSVVYVEI